MRILRIAIAAVATIAASASGVVPAAAAGAPDELIVRYVADSTPRERAAVRDAAGTELERTLPVPGMQLLEVRPDTPASRAERLLERSDDVLYAEPNATRRAFLRPNDPYFGVLWAMENTGQSIRGLPGSPDADTDAADAWDAEVGGGVVVAVVDTGVDANHADLAANVWRNPGESGFGRESNGVDDDRNGRVDDWRGWDFVAGDADPADENGHGTHVAGTIGARRGNGLGVAGVADGSRLMALRVLDAEGSGSVASLISAYAYAASAGAKVVNLSLGSPSALRAERDAIAAFPGMLFVAAAGNGGQDGVGDDNDINPEYPCAYALPNVLCVAASDNRDRMAPFSNYGALSVDLAAPGVNIASTWPGGGYAWSSGTSMATPHVAGAAALLWAAAPGASVSDISSALLAGTDAAQQFSGRTVTGGRLNVLRSLRMVADVAFASPAPAPSPGPDPSPSPGAPAAAPLPPPPASEPPVGDRVAPRVSIRVDRRQRLRRVLRRGVAVRVRCSERSSVRIRLRAGRRVRGVTAPVTIRPGAGKRIVVRIPRGARGRLRAAAPRRARVSVSATDTARNTRTVVARVLLRR